MATFETIVRPYVQPIVGPGNIQSKCQRPPENTKVSLSAQAITAADVALINNRRDTSGSGPSGKASNGSKKGKTFNSSWSYSYKKYMTKKEKEQEKCDQGAVVGSGQAYETKDTGSSPPSNGSSPPSNGSSPPSGGSGGS